MTSELRNLVWLVLAAGLIMTMIAAVVALSLLGAGTGPNTIRVTSGAPLHDPSDRRWLDPAPASGESAAGGRVSVRPLDEAADSQWRFSYGESEAAPLSFETLYGGRTSETAGPDYRRYGAEAGWRSATGDRRNFEPERWRPVRADADRSRPAERTGPDRSEPTAQERLASAGVDTSTPEGKLEAACILDNRSRYACRCLVREVRLGLSAAELDFLTRAGQGEPPATRLRAAGLDLTVLPGLAVKLVEIDAQTRRACRVGLTL